jgi:hypothetical protein
MFLGRFALAAVLLLAPVAVQAQSNPGFADGQPLCANVPNINCPGQTNSLNSAFTNKQDVFSGTPSAGYVPIATGGAVVWGNSFPNSITFQAGLLALNSSSQTGGGIYTPSSAMCSYFPSAPWTTIWPCFAGIMTYTGTAASSVLGHVIGSLGWLKLNGTGMVPLGIGHEGKIEVNNSGQVVTNLIPSENQLTDIVAGATVSNLYLNNSHIVDMHAAVPTVIANTLAIDNIHGNIALAIPHFCPSPTALNATIALYICNYMPAFAFGGIGAITTKYFMLNSEPTAISSLAGVLNVINATASTSPTTGATTVIGGLGVAGAVYGGAEIATGVTTVAGLPTCNAAHEGARHYVTDQNTAVAYRGAVTAGGTTRQAVLCSNSAWIQD